MKTVTVITVSTHDLVQRSAEEWDATPFTEAAQRTIASIQEQTYDDYDFSIVRNVDKARTQELYLFAAKRADSVWLAFVPEGEVWPPDTLDRLVQTASHETTLMVGITDPAATMVRRDYYLDGEGL